MASAIFGFYYFWAKYQIERGVEEERGYIKGQNIIIENDEVLGWFSCILMGCKFGIVCISLNEIVCFKVCKMFTEM